MMKLEDGHGKALPPRMQWTRHGFMSFGKHVVGLRGHGQPTMYLLNALHGLHGSPYLAARLSMVYVRVDSSWSTDVSADQFDVGSVYI